MRIALQDASQMLGIDKSTLHRWLKRANIEPEKDTVDQRRRYLSRLQLQYIYNAHGLQLPAISSAGPAHSADAVQSPSDDRREAPMDEARLSDILARLETLERRINTLESTLAPQPIAQQIAPGIIGWRQFAREHGMAETTVQKAIQSGRLQVVQGEWKVGKVTVHEALDQSGKARFYALFSENSRFSRCDLCPHNQ